jgi:excisionase family DNA binding protein
MPIEMPTLPEIEAAIRRVVREELASIGPSILSTEQAAEIAGVTAKTIRAWTEDGRLRCSHRGRKLVIRRDDLDAYLLGEKRAPDRADAIVASLSAVR